VVVVKEAVFDVFYFALGPLQQKLFGEDVFLDDVEEDGGQEFGEVFLFVRLEEQVFDV
jgi:hypothetical protein